MEKVKKIIADDGYVEDFSVDNDQQIISHYKLLSDLVNVETDAPTELHPKLEKLEKFSKELNMLQRITKVKWIYKNEDRIEAIVLNENSGFVKYCSFSKSDPNISASLWNEIKEACRYTQSNTIYPTIY